MISLKINFQEVQDRVTAARSLQEANQDEESRRVLLALAKDIQEKLDK